MKGRCSHRGVAGVTDDDHRRLVIGYGNPIRCDDGLGPALADRIEALELPGVVVETDYQLVVEHAHDAARFDEVLFVDAAVSGPSPYRFTPVEERPDEGMISHGLSPAGVIHLAHTLFRSSVKGWLLAIRGYDFTPFSETLSEEGATNLEEAFVYAKRWLTKKG